MKFLSRVMLQFGYVRLKDYGYALSPDGRIVEVPRVTDDRFEPPPWQPTVPAAPASLLPAADNHPVPRPLPPPPTGHERLFPRGPGLGSAPAPAASPASDSSSSSAATAIASSSAASRAAAGSGRPGEPEDEEWEWRMALARARARADGGSSASRPAPGRAARPMPPPSPPRRPAATQRLSLSARPGAAKPAATPARAGLPSVLAPRTDAPRAPGLRPLPGTPASGAARPTRTVVAPALPTGRSRTPYQPSARVARGTQGPERIDPTPTGRVKVVQLAQGSSPHSRRRGERGDATQTEVTAAFRAQASMDDPDVTRVGGSSSLDAPTLDESVPDIFPPEAGAGATFQDATMPGGALPEADDDDEPGDELTSVDGPSSLITFVARGPSAVEGGATGITRVAAPAGSDAAPLPRLTARLRKKSGALN